MILLRALLALGLMTAVPVSAQEFPAYDASQFGKIIVAQGQANIPQAQYEALMGTGNIEMISSINPESVIARLGRAVGKLDILTDNRGYAPCTAFLVEKNRLITNYHCIPGVLQHPKVGGTEIVSALFHLGFVRDGSTAGTKTYHVKPTPLEMNQDLDYAVLQILGDANKEFGALELSAATPKDSEPFVVIGHPQGWALRFSREQCKASSPAVEGNRVLHTCDTLPGSSGSPVISDDSRQVIALHSAAAGSVNLAVPMAQILSQSEILKAAVPAKQAVATIASKADPCGPQFALAKQVNQCAVWDVYLASCSSHSKASEARRLKSNVCNVDACDGQFEKAKAINSCDTWTSYSQACGNHDGMVVAEMALVLTCKPVADEKPAEKPKQAASTSKLSAATVEALVRTAFGYYKQDNFQQAFAWYRKAAEQGDAEAQYALGYMYEHGEGVTQSDKESVKWYRKAAEQGDAEAQYALGVRYLHGRGVTQSDKESVKWYLKSAVQGHARAQYALGYMYFFGRGVTQSDKESVKWYLKSAVQGDAKAQCSLALLTTHGRGTAKDPFSAADWTIKSLENGHDRCIKGIAGYATVREIQKILKQRGLYTGATDGINGPDTQAAMRKLLKK